MLNPKLIKVVLVGSSAVGKSSLTCRYIKNAFNNTIDPTIGVDFQAKRLKINDTYVSLQIWDTAGQERFSSLPPMYFRGAQILCMVYDVTDMGTFERLEKWLEVWNKQHAGKVPPIIVVANKIDMIQGNHVDIFPERVKTWCTLHNCDWMKASAKTGENVENVFQTIAEKGLAHVQKTEDFHQAEPLVMMIQYTSGRSDGRSSCGCSILGDFSTDTIILADTHNSLQVIGESQISYLHNVRIPIICSLCEEQIVGPYFRCLDCTQNSLVCVNCELGHNVGHVLVKIRK